MKIMKMIVALCICLMIVSCFSSVFATTVTDVISDMEGKAGPDHAANADAGGLTGAINQVIGMLQYAGSGIALIMVTWCGFKYMMASNEAKADVKKQVLPIVIGAVLLFGAVNLVGIIQGIGQKF